MNLRRFAGKLLSALHTMQAKVRPSYSQAGEDQVVRYLFEQLKISNPSYLDIGTNHPFIGNNTYYFYIRGGKGVCVEPDSSLYALIRKHRSRDVVVQAGVNVGGLEKGELFIFPHPYSGWNTFSKEEAESRERQTGVKVERTRVVPFVSVNELMKQHFSPHPNFLSIDVEGLDLAILHSIDFNQHRPEVICVETVTFSMNNQEVKINEVEDFLKMKGYFLFADTHINSIFCRTDAYKH